jgi:outer membrane protein assembly factor BamB
VDSNLSIDSNGVLYVGNSQGVLFAIQAFGTSPGTLLWQFNSPHDIEMTPVVGNGSLLIASGSALYAISAN